MYNYILDVNVIIYLKNEYFSELWIDLVLYNIDIDMYRFNIYF